MIAINRTNTYNRKLDSYSSKIANTLQGSHRSRPISYTKPSTIVHKIKIQISGRQYRKGIPLCIILLYNIVLYSGLLKDIDEINLLNFKRWIISKEVFNWSYWSYWWPYRSTHKTVNVLTNRYMDLIPIIIKGVSKTLQEIFIMMIQMALYYSSCYSCN